MGIIWTFDLVAIQLGKALFLRLIFNFALVGLVLVIIAHPFISQNPFSVYKKQVSLVHNALVSNIYGPQSLIVSASSSRNVLGQKVAGNVNRSPVLISKKAFPFISARAYLVVDNKSGKILSENNIHVPFAPASTTKLMTALVALDVYDPDAIITIPEFCSKVESTKLWLPTGGLFSVKNLLYSLLISSAGDAGCALANGNMDESEYVGFMNKKAEELGMFDTKFTNPIGLDGEDGAHYSSAWDLYLLSKSAMEKSFIREIVQTKEFSYTDETEKLDVNLVSTNRLLWDVPGTVGIKTGTTDGAGEVLLYGYDDGEKTLTIVVMASDDRFSDTKEILDWVFSSYSWAY